MTEPAITPSRVGMRFSLTTIVTALVWLLLTVITISLPAIYFAVHLQYQHGQADSESEANADFIADQLEEHPDRLITNPLFQRFVKEDQVFKDADAYETRTILNTEGKEVFAKTIAEPLAWPVVSHSAMIKVDGKNLGYFVVARSLVHLLYEAIAIFLVALLCSALIAFLLHRLVLRRMGLSEDALSRDARFDLLTGLPNRHEVLAELQRRLALNEQGAMAVFFVDLDKFKAVNDSYGHAVGDALLQAAGARLRNCIRPEDFVGRLSGAEFVILVSLGDSDDKAVIKRISETIGNAFSLTHTCLGHEVAITATVGIAIAPKHGNQPEKLIQRADTAMYSRKSKRSGGWQIYDPAMTERVDREVRLRAKLKQALERQEFELHYQPIIRLNGNKIIGAEALIRWRDPDTGLLVSPDDFISELEHSGLIVPIGEWVLRTACKQAVQWRKTLPLFHIAVNVSPRQFMEDEFVDSVARILVEEKVAPDAIAIELTESMLLDDALTTRRLTQLKTIGVWLALDDFGTGFSSLGRLASMPFDVIKIDRQFIDQMNLGERQRSVVVAILALSHGLGMNVVAEGIEQPEQLQALIELGCHQGQGFLFSRPIPAEAFDANYIPHHSAEIAHAQWVAAPAL